MRIQLRPPSQVPLLVALLTSLLAVTASATVPGQVNYQGLLLDDLGSPITGPVDMVFSLFSVPSGGSPLWTEEHDAVDVLDGVYEVELGSTTPLTPGLLAGAAVYLEIEVEAEILTPRQRLLAVPYALQAASSEATGGLTAEAATQIYDHFSFDGMEPPNSDPREGTADVDGDGLANFIDTDNDGDGFSDFVELFERGSDINLVSPSITGVNPTGGRACTSTSVHVQGVNFDPGLSVAFGSEAPAAANLIETDFDVTVGPQTPGLVDITVANPNLEADTKIDAFDFFTVTPTIAGFTPGFSKPGETVSLQIQGTDFDSGISVTVGSDTPTPTNVTPTSLEVTTTFPESPFVDVTITNICGEQAMAVYELTEFKIAFVSSVTYDSNLGGIAGADAKCAQLASNAGLAGTYLAWISDGVTDPDSRFVKSTDPYAATFNNALIADDWADLTDGTLAGSVTYDENGNTVSHRVFTNVNPDGTTKDNTNHCNGWGAGGTSANLGLSTSTAVLWTDYQLGSCGTQQRIYCFEQ